MKLDHLEMLYMHELKDLYSVEQQLIKALPKVADKASDSSLKRALKEHLAETKKQAKRIEKIMQNYDFAPGGHRCRGIEGILEEAEDIIKETENPESRDVAIISMCNRIEHYEMAAYGTARAFAETLGKYEEADLLIESLKEESAADHMLSTLAWRSINRDARTAAKAA